MRKKISRRFFLKTLMIGSGAVVSSCLAQPVQRTAVAQVAEEDDTVYLPQVTRSTPPPPPTGPLLTNIFFMHHSVGRALIQDGKVRELLYAINPEYKFWDHYYNDKGLTLPDGTLANYNYGVPNDYTHPVDYAAIFAQPYDPSRQHPQTPVNTFSGFMRHEVIIFKSCFDDSRVESDAMLEEYKTAYISIRARIDQYPEKLFLLLSPPPLRECSVRNDTNVRSRARAFADFLKSDAYLQGHPNMYVFDFFDQLAVPADGGTNANLLKPEYRASAVCDEHPNYLANQTVAPLFVNFIDQSIRDFAS